MGTGCDATNPDAVRKVYEIKQRADSKAMLVLVDSAVKVDFYVDEVPSVAWDLIELADKPMTIIYSGARNWLKTYWRKTVVWYTCYFRRFFASAVSTLSQSYCQLQLI